MVAAQVHEDSPFEESTKELRRTGEVVGTVVGAPWFVLLNSLLLPVERVAGALVCMSLLIKELPQVCFWSHA